MQHIVAPANSLIFLKRLEKLVLNSKKRYWEITKWATFDDLLNFVAEFNDKKCEATDYDYYDETVCFEVYSLSNAELFSVFVFVWEVTDKERVIKFRIEKKRWININKEDEEFISSWDVTMEQFLECIS